MVFTGRGGQQRSGAARAATVGSVAVAHPKTELDLATLKALKAVGTSGAVEAGTSFKCVQPRFDRLRVPAAGRALAAGGRAGRVTLGEV